MKPTSLLRGLLLLCSSFIVLVSQAQKRMIKKFEHNPKYYEMYADKLTLRVFGGQKSTHFYMPSNVGMKDINYEANHKLQLGIGATYRNYSLNIGYGFSSVNNNTGTKGKTKGLDFQFHLYPHKWAIDVMLVMPKGMYIDPKGYASSNPANYYFRPDVKERLWGFAAYKVPNKEKFSYRAAIAQNEWQKKSAGSPLYGAEIYYGIIEGDSAMVPLSIQSGYPQKGITEMRYISIGPGIGYAYTLVMNEHFYIMGSVIANAKYNIVTEEAPAGDKKKSSFSPSTIVKAGLGYNSNNWSVGAYIMGNALWVEGKSSTKDYYLPAGTFRVQVAKKFDMNKKK